MHTFSDTTNTIDAWGLGAASLNNGIYVPNGGTATVYLSWNDTYGSSGNDYNLGVTYTTAGPVYNLAASSTTVQDGNDNPFESVTFTNSTGADRQFDIRIWNTNDAAATRTLEVFVTGSVYTWDGEAVLGWVTPVGSVPANSDAAGSVIGVGAVFASAGTLGTIEYYSSQGPTLDGRTKPDVTATDGVAVTGSGGFSSPFYGTSAAAPHVAGLAALLIDAHPRLQNGAANALAAAAARSRIRAMIRTGTIDKGAAGTDNVFGYGLVDGTAALTIPGPEQWESYSDSGRTTIGNTYSTSPNTVYMRGTTFPAGTYRVAFYDGSATGGGAKVVESTGLTVSGGNLDAQVITSNFPSATAGTWKAVVSTSGSALPATYSAIDWDTDVVVADDSFTVNAGAIPEFPRLFGALMASMAGAGAYLWLRRRPAGLAARS